MIINWANDGSVYNKNELNRNGFFLDEVNDITIEDIENDEDDLFSDNDNSKEKTLNFVGFITNANDDMFVIFPKGFDVDDVNRDSTLIFNCISNHMQKHPDLYFGSYKDLIYKSNYPFAAFFGVYNYYKKYGLFFRKNTIASKKIGKRINWKVTMANADYYVENGAIVPYPLYYNHYNLRENIVSKCMVYCINYTILKFGNIVGMKSIDSEMPSFNISRDRDKIIRQLKNEKKHVFIDSVNKLISDLISFFELIKTGGKYYLKHYSFSSIWEEASLMFLNSHFIGIQNNEFVYENKGQKNSFVKKTFHPDKANPNHFISPDHYHISNDGIQYVFDAKYKSKIKGIDYKQLSYHYLLNGLKDNKGKKMFSKTCSALIVPSKGYDTRINFQIHPSFGNDNSIIIYESYISIRDVINNYLNNL